MPPLSSWSFDAITRALCAALGWLLCWLLVTACQTSGGSSNQRRIPPDEPWRTTRPAAGPTPTFVQASFQHVELPNGLTVYVVEDHALPLLSMALVVRAGSSQETAKEAGLVQVAFDASDEGAGNMSQLALADGFANLGTRLHTSVDVESGVLSTNVLVRHAPAALALLATVVQQPTFAAADFDRVKERHLAKVQAMAGDPHAVSDAVSDALVYGSEHGYGHNSAGSESSLKSLTAARAKRFWTEHVVPKNCALVFVGDVTLEQARAMALTAFSGWKRAGKASKAPPDPKPRPALTAAVIDVPGAPQTSVKVGRAAMASGDAASAAATVLNDIIGGTYSSRLNVKLREQKQWTYDVHSTLTRRVGKGPFFISTDVQTESTLEALLEVMTILDAVKRDGVTDDELRIAKESLIKSLPSTLGLPEMQAEAARAMFVYNLPDDHYTQVVERINAVTAADVKAAAERILVLEDLVVVLAGDRNAIMSQQQDALQQNLAKFGVTDFVTIDLQ